MASTKAVMLLTFISIVSIFSDYLHYDDSLNTEHYDDSLNTEMIGKSNICIAEGVKLLKYQNKLYNRRKISIREKALLLFLLLICGDIELNPGPLRSTEFSIFHQNIRSLWSNKDSLEQYIFHSVNIFDTKLVFTNQGVYL